MPHQARQASAANADLTRLAQSRPQGKRAGQKLAIYTLHIYGLSDASTSAGAGFSTIGGSQFVWNTDTITIAPGAQSTPIQVSDFLNSTFDDDAGISQVLSGSQTINGLTWADATMLEAEYVVTLQDTSGGTYKLIFVSFGGDAYNIQGFVVQGPQPPFGQPLTVVGTEDNSVGVYPYAGSTPSCFTPDTRIALADGRLMRAGQLRRGQWLALADGGRAQLALVLRCRVSLAAQAGNARDLAPIDITANALGAGLPQRRLRLSGQHRLALSRPGLAGLVPAGALLGTPGVRRRDDLPWVDYIHLVLARHALLLAEGISAESFWPGPVAMAGLPARLAARVRAIMGPDPEPAGPLWGVSQARRALARHRDKPAPLGTRADTA